jgi:hypothetical protein
MESAGLVRPAGKSLIFRAAMPPADVVSTLERRWASFSSRAFVESAGVPSVNVTIQSRTEGLGVLA